MNSLKNFTGRFEPALIASVTRGEVTESRHEVEAVIADASGAIIASWGYDKDKLIPLRSAAKLAQALPVIESGAAQRFGLNASELAVMCASHRGHESHIAALAGLFIKLGVSSDDVLVMPPSRPRDDAAAELRIRNHQEFTKLCHMCAGNHAAFICTALHASEPVVGYHHAAHPAQQRAREAIAVLAGVEAGRMQMVPDGCGVPTYALPLAAIATMGARIANPSGLPEARREAVEQLFRIGQLHPDLLSAYDTAEAAVFAVGRGELYVKGGAEGVILLADRNSGYGLALKCRDGEQRGSTAVLGAFVGYICDLAQNHVLWGKVQPIIKDATGRNVGRIRVEGI